MGKRFIDTEIFNDPFFMDLTKDGKLFYIYLITNCNHAGIIELNNRLCQFQTGIKTLETVIKELDNRLVTLKNNFYFLPKFIDFQYPSFPNSKVRQQASAIEILKKFNLFDGQKLTLTKGLANPYANEYDNVTVNVDVTDTVNVWPTFEDFWELYDKKKERKKCEVKWKKIKQADRELIMETLPAYIASTPDIQYRKHPYTYLNGECWHDEITEKNDMAELQKAFEELDLKT